MVKIIAETRAVTSRRRGASRPILQHAGSIAIFLYVVGTIKTY